MRVHAHELDHYCACCLCAVLNETVGVAEAAVRRQYAHTHTRERARAHTHTYYAAEVCQGCSKTVFPPDPKRALTLFGQVCVCVCVLSVCVCVCV